MKNNGMKKTTVTLNLVDLDVAINALVAQASECGKRREAAIADSDRSSATIWAENEACYNESYLAICIARTKEESRISDIQTVREMLS